MKPKRTVDERDYFYEVDREQKVVCKVCKHKREDHCRAGCFNYDSGEKCKCKGFI